MRPSFNLALILGMISIVAAVFQDEVGVTDFHHALIGLPQTDTTFFHRPRKEDKASLLYTLSDVGVVGAVNPSNGQIVWRQQIADYVTRGGGYLRAPEGENWVAAAYGSNVQVWNALTGRNVWQTSFKGEVKDLEIMELTERSRKDVLVLFEEEGQTVLRRLHGALGTVVWEFRETSKDVPLQVSTNVAHIYLISLHGSLTSYSIRATTLDTATGARLDQVNIGTKGEVHEPKDVMFVGANSAAPILAWTSSKMTKLYVFVLGTKAKPFEIQLLQDTTEVNIHAPQSTNAQPHILVHHRASTGNRADVYHITLQTGQLKLAYELPYLQGKGAFSVSTQDANVFFTRILEDEVVVTSSESHGILAKFEKKRDPTADSVHAVSEVLKKTDGTFAVRSAVLTNQGDWVMIRNGEADWSRPEGLSGAVAAVWAEIPESENLAKVLEEEAHNNPVSAYIRRVTRHIDDLKYLPGWLISLPENLMGSLLGEASVKGESLTRDTFGFNKLVVLVTRRGRVYGLDTGNLGQIAWSKEVFPQAAGQSLDIKGILTSEVTGTVEMRGSKGEVLVINATDGSIISIQQAGSEPIAATAVIDGSSFVSFGTDGKITGDVNVDPPSDRTFVVRDGQNAIRGITFPSGQTKTTGQEVWRFTAPAGQNILDVAAHSVHDPVASIGRVLGDRTVLYKYLNANTIVVAVHDDKTSVLSVRLVDTISGQILASQFYKGVDGNKPVSCTLAENWYSCTFFGQYKLDDGTERILKGYQIVVSDLYESPEANDRGSFGEAANFSALNPIDSPTAGIPLPHVLSQAWIVSQPISKLSVTQTRQGIANRQIIGYMPSSHAIVGFPRQFVDPRRPVNRDPNAAEVEAEGLMKYTPAIEIDPRTIISHELDVLGVQHIVASPAVVESTSLLVAYGIDVFGTRLAPSGVFDILGKSFDKLTLIATVSALFVGVTFLAPMIRRKQINRSWEAPS